MEVDKDGYQLLDKEFTSQGFIYKQIYVNEDNIYAIYSQSRPDREKPIAYEVFRITKSEETEIYGRKYPKKYNYPGNSAFGKTAFSVTSLERAHAKIEYLKQKKEDSERAALLPKKGKYIPTGKPRGRKKGWRKNVVN